MNTHDERYVLSIAASHKAVRLRDHQTGEIHEWTGTRALYDALSVLAEWRERDNAHKTHRGAPDAVERLMHLGDDNRTACGKWSGMVYQYTSDRKAVTCEECRSAGRCTCPLGPEDAHFPDCPMYVVPRPRCPACGVTGGMPHDCETAGRIS